MPAVRAGADRAGRSLDAFTVNMKPLVATAPDEARLGPKVRQLLESLKHPLGLRQRSDATMRPSVRGQSRAGRNSGDRS